MREISRHTGAGKPFSGLYKELFSYVAGRWRDLINASFDVLLYDLTGTYFEIDAAAN